MLETKDLPFNEISRLCQRYQVQELAVFGSFLRDDFTSTSDIDFLVEFDPDAEIGFLALSRMARELSELISRQVDLVPKSGLKPMIREQILAGARVLYAA